MSKNKAYNSKYNQKYSPLQKIACNKTVAIQTRQGACANEGEQQQVFQPSLQQAQ